MSLIFQAITWNVDDYENCDEDGNTSREIEFYASGRSLSGNSVTVKITGYTPYFYVLVPYNWNSTDLTNLFKFLKSVCKSGIIDSDPVTELRHKLYPYTALQKFKFLKLSFKNISSFNYIKSVLSYFPRINPKHKFIKKIPDNVPKCKLELYETKVPHINRLCHLRGISTTSFLEVVEYEEIKNLNKNSLNKEVDNKVDEEVDDEVDDEIDDSTKEFAKSDILAIANWKNIKLYEYNGLSPIRVLSWDIECISADGSFPNPSNQSDIIVQIGISYRIVGANKTKYILTVGKCADIQDATVISCKSEKALLYRYAQLFEELDPDIVIGYNIWGFDDNYMLKRFEINGVMSELNKFNRLNITNLDSISVKNLSSNAFGVNTYKLLEYSGRETFDLMIAIQREHKLDSYKLDNVGEYFVGQHKNDITPQQIFSMSRGTPDEIAEVARYCIQDTNLVMEILEQQCILTNYLEMANITCVPISWLLFRGQQCRSYSLIVKECIAKNFTIPDEIPISGSYEFEGATVLEPQRGAYYKPVAGLDFASLYPSIMRAYNLCYSTFITNESYKYISDDTIKEFGTIENFEKEAIENIEWVSEKGVKLSFKFLQNTYLKDNSEIGKLNETLPIGKGTYEGILPSILSRITIERKKSKKLMKEAYDRGDKLMEGIYNGKQLAQKVVLNSIYGFVGAEEAGLLPCKPIGMCVTSTGRKMIEKTASFAQSYYSSTVLYGDSIPGNTPISLSNDNINFIQRPIGEISGHWQPYRGYLSLNNDIKNETKEMIDTKDINIYTKTISGTSRVNKIIRHKTNKKLYKITCKDANGNIHEVTVTEGHSLIDTNGSLIKPTELNIGTKLY